MGVFFEKIMTGLIIQFISHGIHVWYIYLHEWLIFIRYGVYIYTSPIGFL